MAYLKVVVNPDDMAALRVINTPVAVLAQSSIQKILHIRTA